MRFLISAAALCGAFLFCCTTSALARGPSGVGHSGPGGSGGRLNIAGGPAGGGAFQTGGFRGGPGGSTGPNWKANLGQSGATNGTTTVTSQGLHPNLGGGLNGSTGIASTTTSGSTSTSTSGNSNQTTGGSMPAAGKIATAHKLEEQLLKQRMAEAHRLLEQAKQSGDPQMAAKAEQMLQQLKQHMAHERSHRN